ncbi:DHA2 family efflux MFS transporter permease subunit [Phytoactinopolyspora mesophila]|uniref:DHA2 family efflux MFS transporter permease subunit n=1 Tax=Phytoactinopolyspora mesophila TaxID=2650750 RepID=A0A7K3M8F5_9ACTN|nr:DHA2 family efflux MFS transporter permease subunit [Phytoactinopolyspora mesophila]
MSDGRHDTTGTGWRRDAPRRAEPARDDKPSQQQPGLRQSWLALTALSFGFFMLLLDTTIVNIAIPAILDKLQTSLENIIWVNSVYLLTFAVPLLVTGRLGDRYGPKRVFVAGLVIFTVSSLACGMATAVEPLIIGRAIQGLGAAAMMPQTMAFVYHLFPPGRRGAAMGVWGATAGVATVSGPLLGGVLVDSLGWQWIFYVNVPIGVAGLAMVLRFVPDWQPGHSRRFDLPGIGLFTLGLAALIFGLQEGERYDWSTVAGPVTVWWLIGGGLALLALFVIWQRRSRREPLLDLQLFTFRSFSQSILANATLGFALIGTVLPLMLYLQTVRGYSPLMAGVISAPMPLASGVTSAFVGRIAERFDGRKLGGAGFLGYACGLAMLAWTIRTDVEPLLLAPALVLAGVGMGAIFAPLATLGTLSLPPHLVGGGSGLFNTLRQVGAVIGSASIGVLLQARLSIELTRQAEVQASTLPPEFQQQFVDRITAGARHVGEVPVDADDAFDLPADTSPELAEQFREAAEAVFVHGFTSAARASILLPAIVLLLGALACLLMPNPRGPSLRPAKRAS